MVFHAKAIEFYSQCFDSLAHIDEDDDLEVSQGQFYITLKTKQGQNFP